MLFVIPVVILSAIPKIAMQLTLCAYDAPNNIDGPTSWLKRLLPFLQEQGIQTRLLFFANRSKQLRTFQFFQDLGFACKLIPADFFFEEQIRMVLEDLRRHPPNVFIPNYFPVAGYAARYAKEAGIPTVMVLHNDDRYHRALVQEFGTGSHPSALSCVVPVSRMLQQEVNSFPLLAADVVCIPYGAPVPDGQSGRKEGEALKLIYLGRLSNQQKRIVDLTRAFCRATREIPGTEAVIYGNGPALAEVRQILKEEKGAQVRYGGLLQVNEVQDRLLENHVFVLLSDYEGIPVALMEAMACGLVPVCSDIKSGITELITNGQNGVVVRDRGDAFVSVVKKLADNVVYWQTLAAAARNTVRQSYSDEVCYDRWTALIRSLAAQNTYKGSLLVPTVKALKTLQIPQELLHGQTRFPSLVLLPFQRLKKAAGVIRRNHF